MPLSEDWLASRAARTPRANVPLRQRSSQSPVMWMSQSSACEVDSDVLLAGSVVAVRVLTPPVDATGVSSVSAAVTGVLTDGLQQPGSRQPGPRVLPPTAPRRWRAERGGQRFGDGVAGVEQRADQACGEVLSDTQDPGGELRLVAVEKALVMTAGVFTIAVTAAGMSPAFNAS